MSMASVSIHGDRCFPAHSEELMQNVKWLLAESIWVGFRKEAL